MSQIKITNALLKETVELYTGRKATGIDVHADPRVSGAYAIRMVTDKGATIDFLLSAHWMNDDPRNAEDLSGHLEEAEFTTWPPTSGKLRLFT